MPRSDGDLVAEAVLGAGFGLWLFWKGFRELRLKRLISGVATSRARSMAMGTVELAGTAQTHLPLADPIYALPCVYYTLKIDKETGSEKNARWITVHQDSSDAIPFYLQDSTGRVLVLPGGAELHCEPDVQAYSAGFTLFGAKQDAIEKFMRSKAGSKTKLRRKRRIKPC